MADYASGKLEISDELKAEMKAYTSLW